MVVKRDVAFVVHRRYITVIVGGVTAVASATIAGDVLDDIGVGKVDLIRLLHCHRSGLDFGRHMLHGGHLQLVRFFCRASRKSAKRDTEDEQRKEKFAGNFH